MIWIFEGEEGGMTKGATDILTRCKIRSQRSEVRSQKSPTCNLQLLIFDFAEEPPVLERASARVKIARKISLQDCVQAILIFGQGVLMVLFGVHFRRGAFFSRIIS